MPTIQKPTTKNKIEKIDTPACVKNDIFFSTEERP